MIAEIKHRSPSAGEILPGADGKIETLRARLPARPRRGDLGRDGRGSLRRQARMAASRQSISGLPVLMKDFVISRAPARPRRLARGRRRAADRSRPAAEELAGCAGRARARPRAVVEVHDAAEIAAAGRATRRPRSQRPGPRDVRDEPRRSKRIAAKHSSGAGAPSRERHHERRTSRASWPRATRRSSSARRSCAMRTPRRCCGSLKGDRVKICGLTRPEDVDAACALGAAYVGFNFAAVSSRRVTLDAARDLARSGAAGRAASRCLRSRERRGDPRGGRRGAARSRPDPPPALGAGPGRVAPAGHRRRRSVAPAPTPRRRSCWRAADRSSSTRPWRAGPAAPGPSSTGAFSPVEPGRPDHPRRRARRRKRRRSDRARAPLRRRRRVGCRVVSRRQGRRQHAPVSSRPSRADASSPAPSGRGAGVRAR